MNNSYFELKEGREGLDIYFYGTKIGNYCDLTITIFTRVNFSLRSLLELHQLISDYEKSNT